MARQDFQREITLPAPPPALWKTITDVPLLTSWISSVEDAREIEPLSRYRAVLMDRMGMFSLRADLDIRVVEHEEPTHVHATAEGEDRQVGARITVDADLRMTPHGEGTTLAVSGSYEVTGRMATLGGSAIRRKADKILEEFFANLERELA